SHADDLPFRSTAGAWASSSTNWPVQGEAAVCPEGIYPTNPIWALNNIETTTSNPYTITGLDDGTVYDIYVRAVCDSTNESAWSGPYSIQTVAIGTDCDNPFEITALPFNHTSDTEIYDNIYSVKPGATCS